MISPLIAKAAPACACTGETFERTHRARSSRIGIISDIALVGEATPKLAAIRSMSPHTSLWSESARPLSLNEEETEESLLARAEANSARGADANAAHLSLQRPPS